MCTIKVCGIGNIDDARLCAELGVDFIGLNFCPPSPRYINSSVAADIVTFIKRSFPHVKTVGVFQNEDMDSLLRIMVATAIDIIQLHGDENSAYQSELRIRSGKPLIKALRLRDNQSQSLSPIIANWVLLDSFHPQQYGGTGIPLDLSRATTTLHAFGKEKIILAGGINPDNVHNYLALSPYGIDINSGVEREVGHKDSEKLATIVTMVRGGTQ